MKKLFTVVFTMLLAGSLAFAQAGGPTGGDTSKAPKDAASGKKATKAKKTHKSKKSKKGSAGTTGGSPTPK